MVTIAGMITSVVRKQTKNGDLWAIATVEDLESSVEVLLFPKVYASVASALAQRHRRADQGTGADQGRRRRD